MTLLRTTVASHDSNLALLSNAVKTQKGPVRDRSARDIKDKQWPSLPTLDVRESAIAIKLHDFVFTTDAGHTIYLNDLPDLSNHLSADQSLALFASFEDRIKNYLTSGQIASCFEVHINYVIGGSTELSIIQRDLVEKLCMSMRSQPFPGLWIAEFIFNNLEQPEIIQDVLTASFLSKENYLERLEHGFAVDKTWKQYLTTPCEIVRIVAVGYSFAFSALIRAIAAEEQREVIVYVPRLEELKRPRSADDFVQSCLIDIQNISIQILDESDLAPLLSKHKIDLTFVSAKVFGATKNSEVQVVSNATSCWWIHKIKSTSIEVGKSAPPVIVAGGLFKIWPSKIFEQYLDSNTLSDSNSGPSSSTVLRASDITTIVTEIGCIAPTGPHLPETIFLLETENVVDFTLYRHLKLQSPETNSSHIQDRKKHSFLNALILLIKRNDKVGSVDAILLGILKDAHQRPQMLHDGSFAKASPMSFSHIEPDFETSIANAKSYLDDLLHDPKWLSGNNGKYIAISAHPQAYVIADTYAGLRKQPGYKSLGSWYKSRVAVDLGDRQIPGRYKRRIVK